MRFVCKTDKKIKGAEARSKYYIKYGNPNYGNIKGLLSSSFRSKLKTRQQIDAVSDLDDEQAPTNGSQQTRQPVSYDGN